MKRALILGIGNTVRSDDGVGVHVARRLAHTGTSENVDVAYAGTSGFGLLDLVTGYDSVVIVDAIDCGQPPGTILELTLEDLGEHATSNTINLHESDLVTILETGRRLGLKIPPRISIVAVQIQDAKTLSERCTPAVEAAIGPACARAIRVADSLQG